MKIIVIGAGKVGKEICRQLARENHDVVAVDTEESDILQIVSEADIKGLTGNGELASVQKEAGALRADLTIAVTAKDETNILCCLVAKALGTRHTVARVRDPGLAEQAEFMREYLGIDALMNPEYETAVAVSRLLRYPAAAEVDYSDKARVEIVSVEIDPGNALIGMTLKEISASMKLKILICAVGRGDEVIIPKGDFVFAPGDNVFVTGRYISLDSFFKRCGMAVRRIKSAMIIGGGRITRYLAESLHDNGIAVKVIEQDKAVCEQLSEDISFASVICGSGTDKELLKEEGAEETDALIALTGHDEMNIMVSLYAKNHGAGRIITKINEASFAEIADSLGLGAVVSPKNVMSEHVLRFVRSLGRRDDSVLSYYPLLGGRAQAVAFKVGGGVFAGKPLKKISLKKDILIASVVKGGFVSVPDGSTVLDEGDTVLVITTGELKSIEDILA